MSNHSSSQSTDTRCFRIPATRQTAVRALAELRATEEFRDKLLVMLGQSAPERDSALTALESFIDGLTPRVAGMLARDAMPDSEIFYMELDSTVAVPYWISEQFTLVWTLGALAAMAFVRSTVALNRIAMSRMQDVLQCSISQLEARQHILLGEWHREKQAILWTHQSIPYRHDQVDFMVVGEKTAHPYYRVVPRG